MRLPMNFSKYWAERGVQVILTDIVKTIFWVLRVFALLLIYFAVVFFLAEPHVCEKTMIGLIGLGMLLFAIFLYSFSESPHVLFVNNTQMVLGLNLFNLPFGTDVPMADWVVYWCQVSRCEFAKRWWGGWRYYVIISAADGHQMAGLDLRDFPVTHRQEIVDAINSHLPSDVAPLVFPADYK